jgi:hypothetical protein
MKRTFLTMVFIVGLLFVCDASLFAQSGASVASKISSFYSSFVRPVLIAWVVIMAAIGGVMASNKVRKNEDESSEAMIGWFKMVIWPIVVLGVAEIGNAMYN